MFSCCLEEARGELWGRGVDRTQNHVRPRAPRARENLLDPNQTSLAIKWKAEFKSFKSVSVFISTSFNHAIEVCIIFCHCILLEVKLPFYPVCLSVGLFFGLSVIIYWRGEKFHFLPIGALVCLGFTECFPPFSFRWLIISFWAWYLLYCFISVRKISKYVLYGELSSFIFIASIWNKL